MPYFAEAAAPLYDIWRDSMARFKRKTSANARKVKLADVPEWETRGRAAFEKVKECLEDSVTTSFFDPELVTCVFGDASAEYWCLAVTQCKPEDLLDLPWSEQVGKHRLLALESGRFRHAQLRWHIVEKEAFVFGVKAADFAHWINGGRHPARFYTDHKNLLALFDDKARPLSCTKSNRERLTRWGITLLGLNYEIYHIDGEENRLADLGSRWGNRFAAAKVGESREQEAGRALATGLAGGCATMTSGVIKRQGRPSAKKVLRTAPPKTDDKINGPDQDVEEFLLLPEENLLLDS